MAQKSAGFSPVGDLLSQSVELVKSTWNKLLVLSLIAAAGVIAYVLLVGLIIGGSVLGGAALMGGNATAGAGLLGFGGLFAVISALVYIAFFALFGATMIKIVADGGKKSVGEYLKESLGLAIPVFFVSLATGLLSLGGMGLLIIPGLAISILLSFSIYEVVLYKASIGTAMRTSATVVSRNFGAIALRWLVVIALSLVSSFIMSYLTRAAAIFGLLNMVVQTVFTWFFLAYWFLVYKEARAATDIKSPVSTVWMYIVAALGWLIILVAGMALAKGISELLGNPEFQRGLQGITKSDAPMEDYSDLYDAYNSEQNAEDGTEGSSEGELMNPSSEGAFDSIIENSDMTPEEQEETRKAMEQFIKMMESSQEQGSTEPGGAGL